MSATETVTSNPFQKAVRGVSSLGPGERFVLCGLTGASKAWLLSRAFRSDRSRPFLVVLSDQERAESFAADLRFFLGTEEVLFYPSSELLPFEVQTIHPDISARRILFLHSILAAERPFVAVTAAPNLVERVIPKDALIRKVLRIELGSEYPREELLARLHEMGYARMSMVEERGEMSIRGAILDIYPPPVPESGNYPVRIEFFGDAVESIRTFDPSTQRSQKELLEVLILPARVADLSHGARMRARERLLERVEELGMGREAWEPLYNRLRDGTDIQGVDALLPLFYERLDTVFDYLPEDTLAAVVDPSAVEAGIKEFSAGVDERSSAARSFVRAEELYSDGEAFHAALRARPLVEIEPLNGEGIEIETESNLDLRQDITLKKDLSPLRERIRSWLDHGLSVYLTAHNRAQAERMQELLDGFSTSVMKGPEMLQAAARKERASVNIVEGTLSAGFRLASESIVIVTEEEIFGERIRGRRPPSKKLDTFLSQLKDLSEGDFIVHALHGIGIYRGLKRLEFDDTANDFLLIEYRDGDRLYLPVQRMDLVTRYHGVEGRQPEPDKLGGRGWERKKAKVRKAVDRLAGELLRLYAARNAAEGYAFSAPGRLFTEFEAGFEYDETPDQERAIEEVMHDMGLKRPMDRLVCGDVGYGKTEVAMRAAFRAVLDGKQVAVLVPTTVLAQQHYLTFKKRFAPYPVTVAVLSRFRSRTEQMDTLARLREGRVDIIIGTHRLLQKDVVFKDLGLIVIDEEHRFGVRHKERLKGLKKEVDVLTLTATPIPRTLHMSLADIRDLSIINTPPEDRLAITTRIIRFDEGAIREAIEREIKRGGQVFFVHNRVQNIGAMHEYLRTIVAGISPDIRIGVAHGQMREGELEKVMLAFVNREYDILLSTTIIESGLDIPAANTIIINRADRFGLAELYQLRGRVGRSNHRAYAYLICPDASTLTAEARKRMEVIRELSELGSGFRIAAYDLEIRGAGELLGARQSGHIAEVGFDMYTQLLEEAVKELRGEKVIHEPEPEINIKVSQYIPEEYVPDTRQRINIYKRLATAATRDELAELREELTDRYGTVPQVAENLFDVAALKLALKSVGAIELVQKAMRLYVTFSKEAVSGRPDLIRRVMDIVKRDPAGFRLTPDEKLVRFMPPDADPLDEARYLLKELTKW